MRFIHLEVNSSHLAQKALLMLRCVPVSVRLWNKPVVFPTTLSVWPAILICLTCWRFDIYHPCSHILTSMSHETTHRTGTVNETMFFFSRGKGPLKNASDVISAAKKIAEAGSRMDKLGRAIADQVSWTIKSVLQGKKRSLLVNYPCACFSLKDLNPCEALQWNATVHNLSPSQLLSLDFSLHLSKIATETMMQKTPRICKSNPRSPTLIFLESSSYSWSWVTMTGSQASWKYGNISSKHQTGVCAARVLSDFSCLLNSVVEREIVSSGRGFWMAESSLIPPRRPLLSVCHLIKRVCHAVLTSQCSIQITSLTCPLHS